MAKTQLEINAAAANLASRGSTSSRCRGTRGSTTQICDTIARLFAARAEGSHAGRRARASFVENKGAFATHEAEELPEARGEGGASSERSMRSRAR